MALTSALKFRFLKGTKKKLKIVWAVLAVDKWFCWRGEKKDVVIWMITQLYLGPVFIFSPFIVQVEGATSKLARQSRRSGANFTFPLLFRYVSRYDMRTKIIEVIKFLLMNSSFSKKLKFELVVSSRSK